MSKLAKVAGVGVLVILGLVGGVALWAKTTADSTLAQTFEVHSAEFPVPFPLTEAEVEALRAEKLAAMSPAPTDDALVSSAGSSGAEGSGAEPVDPLAGVDLAAIAMERAVARGEHLVNSRYACVECHGKDFGGGTMIDDPAMGRILGRNLTQGKGSVTLNYTVADWDRMVRHGVKPDGTPAIMPSEDFYYMSDRELSDILAYIGSRPPVDKEVPPPAYGPVGTMLIATGQLHLAAVGHPDHGMTHAVEPPEAAVTVEFGKHLAHVCTGCHNPELTGGPIVGGDPSWVPARNLTPHADGLQGWTYEQFVAAVRQGKRPDGTSLQMPMTLILPYAQKMTDTELQALWAYLQQVPAKPSPS